MPRLSPEEEVLTRRRHLVQHWEPLTLSDLVVNEWLTGKSSYSDVRPYLADAVIRSWLVNDTVRIKQIIDRLSASQATVLGMDLGFHARQSGLTKIAGLIFDLYAPLARYDWVVARDGRIGRIEEISRQAGVDGKIVGYRLQFGPDGPFQWFKPHHVRKAGKAEVKAAGLEGVG